MLPCCIATFACAKWGTTPEGAVFCSTGGGPVGSGGFSFFEIFCRTRTGGIPGAVDAATGGSCLGGGLPGAPIDVFIPSGRYDGFVPAGRLGGCRANGFSTRSFFLFLLSSSLNITPGGGVGFGGGRDILLQRIN